MSKKFPISFNKNKNKQNGINSSNNDGYNDLGLSMNDDNATTGYSSLNDDIPLHFSSLNDLIENQTQSNDVNSNEKIISNDINVLEEKVDHVADNDNKLYNQNINLENGILNNEQSNISNNQVFLENNEQLTINNNLTSLENNNNEQLSTNNKLKNEIDYDESNLGFVKRPKINKKILIIVASIILLFIIGLIIYFSLKPGILNNISISSNDIMYYGENNKLKVSAIGKYNLKGTKMLFNISNSDIAELKDKELIGKNVNNSIYAYKTGSFNLDVSGIYNDVIKTINKNIVICKRLSDNYLPQERIIAYLDESIKLNIDLGDEICYKNITFKIDDTSIAEIDNNRMIKGNMKGYTYLYINEGNVSKKLEIQVVDRNNISLAEEIVIENKDITMNVSEKLKLNVSLKPSNVTNKNINYISSDEKIASVDNTGEVKALNKGRTTITIKSDDNNVTEVVNIIVKDNSSLEDEFIPSSVTIKSNNSNKKIATVNDLIILTIKFDRKISSFPIVNILGENVNSVCSETSEPICIATVKVNDSSKKGNVEFSISGYKDETNNEGKILTTTTDNSMVTIN